jgi:serine/threonine protein kinase
VALRRRSRQREDETFPGFTDVVRIGAGGFSTVFRAREVETNRTVALKILNVHDVSEHALGSFQRETFALGTLSAHPNIVTLYRTLTTEDDRPVLVLELCHGSIWERTRDQGQLAPWESVAVMIKIAGALETAHRAGMLHRDIKPENVLITQYGEPALADFGVARLQSTSQATAGVFGFTTIHAAPELLEGRDLSAATDVYGLASTLYQLVAGKAAFRSFEDEGPASVILRILRDPVQPLVAEGVPVALSDLLVSSMSKNPYDRPASALELADELRSIEAANSWPDTPYAIEEAVALERWNSARPGRFQVRGVDAPEPPSSDMAAERPAPPLILTEPVARPDAPPRPWDPVIPVAGPDAPATPSEPVSPEAGPYAPDPASETVFVRSGPGRVEVPRGERRVLTPLGRPAPVAPAPIRPVPPVPAPAPQAPVAPPAKPDPVLVEPTSIADPIEIVFPLAPDPAPIGAEPVVAEPEPPTSASEPTPEPEPEPVLNEAAPRPPAPEPVAETETEFEPALTEGEPEWAAPQPEPIQPEPILTEPIRTEPIHARLEPEAAPAEQVDLPAARVAPAPRFDHLFDEEEERANPTIRPPTQPVAATSASIPTTWARPRFLSSSFSFDDDSNERRTRPTPVVKRATETPPVPLHAKSKRFEFDDSDPWSEPDRTGGVSDASRDDDPDKTEGDDRSRKSRRRQKRH